MNRTDELTIFQKIGIVVTAVALLIVTAVTSGCSNTPPGKTSGYECINLKTGAVLEHVNDDFWNLDDTDNGFYGYDRQSNLRIIVKKQHVEEWGCRVVYYDK